jgi:hypothetical protein
MDCTKAQRSVECEQRAAAAYTRHHHPHLISPQLYIPIDGHHFHTLNAKNPLHLVELLTHVGQLAMKVPETL